MRLDLQTAVSFTVANKQLQLHFPEKNKQTYKELVVPLGRSFVKEEAMVA